MNEADWKTVAMGEQTFPAESGGDLKKTSLEKSWRYTCGRSIGVAHRGQGPTGTKGVVLKRVLC